MKIAICDDDKRLRRQLRQFLETNLALMGIPSDIIEYESGSALLSLTPQNAPDMLFLDIEMPGTGGMDTARALRRAGHRMLLIFVTAYPDYVFEGYEVQAFHYILKPYQESRLKEVLEKAAYIKTKNGHKKGNEPDDFELTIYPLLPKQPLN